MPPGIDRLAVPALVRGLHVVVKPCNPPEAFSSRKLAGLAVQRAPCPPNPFDGRYPLFIDGRCRHLRPSVPGKTHLATPLSS
jgi:hypothetical protein